jgi:FeS assembly protein IscX
MARPICKSQTINNGVYEMKWTDVQQIAEELYDQHPDVDPRKVRFVDLHNYVVELEDFDDDHSRGGERVLEAIQAAWIAETE